MSKSGTQMNQEDYMKLKEAAKVDAQCGHPESFMTDEQAIIFVNSEFGFEASRIRILHEAELDVTEVGSRYLKLEKISRKPLYVSTDWNYVRFNIASGCGIWFYEAINGDLAQLCI